ncbi:hypothetical protein BDV97DRAFT_418065 [Delphinella strobiligena]|nr:hypothetical protein BDV97DRAFT_418065 [Delphinella strobiligena]
MFKNKSKQDPLPKISIWDLFKGSGRTIRESGRRGTPGFPFLPTNLNVPSQKEAVKATVKAKAPSERTKVPSEKPISIKNDNQQDAAKKVGVKNDAKKVEANEPAGVAVFTPEQDAQLLLLKLQNKTWRDISQQMGKPAGVLRHRFREIKPSRFDTAAAVSKRRHDKGKYEGKHDNERRKKERKQEHERRQSSTAASAYAPASVTSSATLGVFQLEEDEDFSYGELQALFEILDADMSMVWDRVASTFYNNSGRRVLPSVIKGKLLSSAVLSSL